MMLQAIALAITCFICFAFGNLTEWFICLVLEEFALVGNPAEHAPSANGRIGHARGGLHIHRLLRVVSLIADCAIGKNGSNSRR
jgi:hypothetical protein